MGDFRKAYPLETEEFDNSVLSAGEYRGLHNRIASDDLPRFESDFKTYLNTNTIRNIAGFHSQLTKQAELIKRRIETINDSLVDIDYNPGRFIRLEPHPTVNVDIRDFRKDLRECTSGSLSGDESNQYSEQKFLQVKSLIERFRGREGQTEPDRQWTRRVTDVRNWFTFPRPSGGAPMTPSTRTTPTRVASPAVGRRSSPTRSSRRRWLTSSNSTGE
jgi:uncharacterized protein YPO0396